MMCRSVPLPATGIGHPLGVRETSSTPLITRIPDREDQRGRMGNHSSRVEAPSPSPLTSPPEYPARQEQSEEDPDSITS